MRPWMSPYLNDFLQKREALAAAPDKELTAYIQLLLKLLGNAWYGIQALDQVGWSQSVTLLSFLTMSLSSAHRRVTPGLVSSRTAASRGSLRRRRQTV